MKKILLLTDVKFWEKCSGDRIRIEELIRFLSTMVKLTVVATGPAPLDIEHFLSLNYAAEFLILEHKKILSSAGYGRRLQKHLKDESFDTVIIEYVHSSYFLNYLQFEAQIILDAHDIVSERGAEFSQYGFAGALYELSSDDEMKLFKLYDYVMLLCKPDQELIKNVIGIEKALLCAHPVPPVTRKLRKKAEKIAFVASAYIPNRDAINWFIRECWPAITDQHQVQLFIYGTVGYELDIQERNDIKVMGFWPDRDSIYNDSDIMINPVRFGAGLKIKNIEALANGLPLVTTTHGARGIESAIDHAFLVGDGTAFAQQLNLLIGNYKLRKKLVGNARAYVEANYSAENCFQSLLNAIL
ncbi:Glycosyltransferase involved in cell wall bisynthesis [Mucilaginibacter lappiensis]|uniref:Glycosyltransferase involved in cell wall biosynthesis n=1 Tax=Mucilaginibacter lappiensis TaxID=354630 RepID=A0ABR6PSX1_9SPHI|nr:glycosyltransferase family 4 protein [Mucilaginibacter lappiensis]MBB6112883.1 glycosyltransferase involved in cell wall biosynthesis [Mucilaginibacter lappiensis]SIS08852.1 Glycosyltransferase involved in cell wall bisynthesis [Mucilaginibacter lappiensis]